MLSQYLDQKLKEVAAIENVAVTSHTRKIQQGVALFKEGGVLPGTKEKKVPKYAWGGILKNIGKKAAKFGGLGALGAGAVIGTAHATDAIGETYDEVFGTRGAHDKLKIGLEANYGDSPSILIEVESASYDIDLKDVKHASAVQARLGLPSVDGDMYEVEPLKAFQALSSVGESQLENAEEAEELREALTSIRTFAFQRGTTISEKDKESSSSPGKGGASGEGIRSGYVNWNNGRLGRKCRRLTDKAKRLQDRLESTAEGTPKHRRLSNRLVRVGGRREKACFKAGKLQ